MSIIFQKKKKKKKKLKKPEQKHPGQNYKNKENL